MNRMTDDRLMVGQAADRLGVTVRTLHHWDAQGLVRPSERTGSGYRLYTERDLNRLERVVIYRELGLSLESIRDLLDDPASNVVTTLEDLSAQVEERIRQLQSLNDRVHQMITAQKRGIPLSEDVQREVLGEDWNPAWPTRARERWGDNAQWRQYEERAASRTAAGWSELASLTGALDEELADAARRGIVPGSGEANALVDRHRDAFSVYFPMSRQMQVCLGRLYESDPSFAAHYDGAHPGLASWLRQAIDASASAHGIDPDAASWE